MGATTEMRQGRLLLHRWDVETAPSLLMAELLQLPFADARPPTGGAMRARWTPPFESTATWADRE